MKKENTLYTNLKTFFNAAAMTFPHQKERLDAILSFNKAAIESGEVKKSNKMQKLEIPFSYMDEQLLIILGGANFIIQNYKGPSKNGPKN